MGQPYVISPSFGSDPADEWIRLGVECQMAGKLPDADRHYRQALRLDPRHAIATQNLAVLLAQQNQLNEALLTIERAALFDGDTSIIHVNRAFMCLEADRIDEALDAARHSVAISPKDKVTPEAQQSYLASRLALAMISATAGNPETAIPLYNELLERDPKHVPAGVNACFVQTLVDASAKELLDQRRKWARAHRPFDKPAPHDNNRDPNRCLRVGYVGGDFKRHSASMIFGAVLLHHDPANVDMYLYSSLPVDPNADDMTRRFQAAVGNNALISDKWRDISAMSDEDADKLIRRDKIDILVDLAAHTAGGRLGIFLRKPAPVQVTAWGFAHGTGLDEIDYFIADPVSVPESERQHYAEKILDLPCIVTYLPPEEYGLKGRSPLPYHANDYITFGCYARYEKMSDRCLETFAEILRRVPDSKLQFKDHAFRRPYSIKRVLSFMKDIDPRRLLFSISTNHNDHLLAYQQADLCLAPFPHASGCVGLETVYMGVPIVTLLGTQPGGRTTAAVLTSIGHPEWVAKTPVEYVDVAVRMANDVPALGKIRKTLRDEFLASPVVKGYREAVEAKYREIWKEWCAK